MLQAAGRESDGFLARRIERLHVVDDDQNRGRPGEQAHGGAECRRDHPRLRRVRRCVGDQQCHPHCPRLRRRQLAGHGVQARLQQVGQPGKRHRMSPGAARPQHREPVLSGQRRPGPQQCRLARAGRPGQRRRAGRFRQHVEERGDGPHLGVTPKISVGIGRAYARPGLASRPSRWGSRRAAARPLRQALLRRGAGTPLSREGAGMQRRAGPPQARPARRCARARAASPDRAPG